VLQHVSEVVEGVAGGRDDPQSQFADLDLITVADRDPVKRHLIGAVDVIAGAGLPG
jgi:hypothetical protein